jgi:RNA polymerase sigma factor (sigma-70 family)
MAELPREDFARVLAGEAAWLRRMARGRTDSASLDDLAQEVWLKSVRRRPSAAGARPWLRVMARFLLRDAWRSERRRKRREAAAAKPNDEVGTPEEKLAQAQLQRIIVEELKVMAAARREILQLRFFEARTPAEIARQLALPPGTVRRRLKEGLDELRAALDRHHGGRREVWQRALIPLLPGAGAKPLSRLSAPAGPRRRLPSWRLSISGLAGIILVAGTLFLPWRDQRPAAPPLVAANAMPSPARVPQLRPTPLAETRPSTDEAVTVMGEVRTADGDPVPGARITLTDVAAREIVASAVSGREGQFQILGVRPSRFQITAIGDAGWASAAIGALAAGAQGHVSLLLAPSVATITGRVSNAATGSALGGAQVVAALTGGGAERFSTSADDRGHFALKVRRGARYEVYAVADGHNTVNLFESIAGDRVLDFPLQPLAMLKGRIVEAGSRRPAAARLTIAGEPTLGEELFVQSADVDATGQFELAIAPGRYRLFAQAGDRFGSLASLSIAAGASATAEIVLRPASRVRGRVVSSDGAGVSGAKVVAQVTAAELAGPSSSATTDARGNYELLGLPATELEVRARAAGYAPARARLAAGEVGSGQLGEMRLQASGGLLGSVRDGAGRSLAGLVVRATFQPAGPAPAAPRAASAVSDESGGFSFDEWPRGKVWLATKAPDGSAASIGPLTIEPGAMAAADLIVTPAAWIAGRALRPDGKPAAEVPIDAVPLGNPAAVTFAASTFTDEAGWFRVGPLPAGRVGLQLGSRIVASTGRKGISPALPSREVTLAPGQELADFTLTLPARDGSISGRVIDERGVAIANTFVDVYLYSPGPRPRGDHMGRVLSDARGSFELSELPAALYEVQVRHAPLAEERRIGVAPSPTALIITLRDPASGRNSVR